MNILYGVPTFGRVSETFVRDLWHGLSRSNTVHIICDQSVRNSGRTADPILFEAGSQRTTALRRMRRSVMRRVSRQRLEELDQRYTQRLMSQTVKRLLQRTQIDVAYADFGKMGVHLLPALLESNIPFVVHFHGFDITRSLNRRIYRESLPQLFEKACSLIVASHHIRHLLVLEGAPEHKIHVVRLGVEIPTMLVPMGWEDRNRLAPRVAFLGRLVEKKNPVALVEAFRIVLRDVPAARLAIIGDGPERARLEERVAFHGISSSVDILGAMSRDEALPIVNSSWVYAQHSVTARDGDQEGFGVSIAEAAALGLPIVSTFHNGIPEQVVHDKTGFLVPEHDYEAMAASILTLLRDSELRQRMGAEGRTSTLALCNTERRVTEIEKILEEASR